jgi:hypothetical protein
MNRRNLSFLICALALLAGAAVFYLTSSSDSAVGHGHGVDDSSASDTAAKSASASIVRPDEVEKKKSNFVPLEVKAEDYTTRPKANTVEGRLLKIWADRQLPDPEKVERLLGAMSGLDDAGKKLALDYATQLITDDDYVRQRPRLLRVAASDELREVVMLDMLTRDDGIKMSSLVELMKTPSPTTRSEAREILEAFLDKDYGDDPQNWDAPVQQWVAENQDI